MLSQKARYGLRALVELARHDGQVTSGELAVRAGAPRKFLEAILLELARNRIVVSRRGKFGGYRLAKPAGKITIGSVVRLIDGPLAPIGCVSKTAYQKCHDCPYAKKAYCPLQDVMGGVRNAIADILDNHSLEDFISGSRGPRKRSGR